MMTTDPHECCLACRLLPIDVGPTLQQDLHGFWKTLKQETIILIVLICTSRRFLSRVEGGRGDARNDGPGDEFKGRLPTMLPLAPVQLFSQLFSITPPLECWKKKKKEQSRCILARTRTQGGSSSGSNGIWIFGNKTREPREKPPELGQGLTTNST